MRQARVEKQKNSNIASHRLAPNGEEELFAFRPRGVTKKKQKEEFFVVELSPVHCHGVLEFPQFDE